MSNCIQPSGRCLLGVVLDSRMFKGVRVCETTDGNAIRLEDGEFVLYVGFTTWRELRHFLWDHVQPYVVKPNTKIPLLLRDECDNFTTEFRATVNLLPPGTKRPVGEGKHKLWKSIL